MPFLPSVLLLWLLSATASFLLVAGNDLTTADGTVVAETTTTTTVLVTGATGRLGSHVYSQLVQQEQYNVRALVRSIDKARDRLGCDACDESEGIFLGDVTVLDTLLHAMQSTSTTGSPPVSTVIVAVGASPYLPEDEIRAVEFESVQMTVEALVLAQEDNMDATADATTNLKVVLCSSMGTTNPTPSFPGHILFWKLQAEVFLASSGVLDTAVVVKPCGLLNEEHVKGPYTLLTGHDDTLLEKLDFPAMPRGEVARVMVHAIGLESDDLRFDLCAIAGPTTTDLDGLLESAQWTWTSKMQSSSSQGEGVLV